MVCACDSAFADTISALGNALATIGVCTWRARVVHIFRLNFKEKQKSADGGGLQAAATQAQWACRRFFIASFGDGDAPNPLRACALETPSRSDRLFATVSGNAQPSPTATMCGLYTSDVAPLRFLT